MHLAIIMSAYAVQFYGSFAGHNWDSVWKARAENKCKFFSWLALQNRLWTADRIVKHGGQANTICRLCYTHQESALRMLATCPYSVAVWIGLQGWLGVTFQAPAITRYRPFKSWWNSLLRLQDPNATDRVQKMVYTVWNIWKERCRRVFDNKGISEAQLQEAIRQDVQQCLIAWRPEHQNGAPD
jgi:hypothetical protein